MATKKWSAKVDTDSTHPDQGLFNKNASAIAKALASKKVSPKGPASGMRMLNFYINRAGKNLSASRKAELRKAKTHLSALARAAAKGEPTLLTDYGKPSRSSRRWRLSCKARMIAARTRWNSERRCSPGLLRAQANSKARALSSTQ